MDKEFAFTKLIKCGLCDSGVSGQEKFKKLASGGITKYIYYGCSRSKDLNCKSGYIREEELIKQLIELLDQLELKESEIIKKYRDEVNRLKRFQNGILGIKDKVEPKNEFDIKQYARYILQEGNVHERREFLTSINSEILLTHKILTL